MFWFTDPKTHRKTSFFKMLVFVSGRDVFLTLIGRNGDVIDTVPGCSKNAKAAYKAARARGCVCNANASEADSFMDPQGKARDRFDGG